MKYILITIIFLFSYDISGVSAPENELKKLAASKLELLSNFNGVWIGKLTGHKGHNLVGEPTGNLKLIIDGGSVEVFTKTEEKWKQVKKGQFKIETHKTNAIIFSLDSGESKFWVETWSLNVSQVDNGRMLVLWNRIVNNYPLESFEHEARGAMFASGYLVRVPKK
ncbi:hypothetical protein FLL45_01180 [Aliikangiella marina]|uniref:Uncharacterized protein n=1 Tax=Aliikangiella marina TaxID=1712262 RepID=A0A545TH91_9GAMM|nr:hypothetical protein [Aliikangiella marina]TQV76599.1 hypothetical protein FLL45_01180 [Aliikangiella marina]